jgi:tagaturonate epimerase
MKLKKTELTRIKKIQKLLNPYPVAVLKIYPQSFCIRDELTYGLIRTTQGKRLVVRGERGKVRKDPFKGKNHHHEGTTLKLCDLSPENTACLTNLFPYTRPVSLRAYPVTVGTGDRLGCATPGHLRAVRRYPVRPILAQQSVRENKQTGRGFIGVVSDAAWAVFQENYQGGYGADGDHLKTLDEIEEALNAGVSMVTLDLTEQLNPSAFSDSKEVIDRKFEKEIHEEESKVFFHLFLNKEFHFKGLRRKFSIQFNEEDVKRNALLFHKAIDFTEEAYQFFHSRLGGKRVIDFEISVDETPFATSPENHLFFVILLSQRGIRIDSLAPRFIGEFQKGIDYKGDIEAFRRQFYQHAMIAKDYGCYKISIHSGSDKFSVFPSMGELAGEGLHLKTAGTSWLEAMRLIAGKVPPLYREMHQYALSVFYEATKLYHVTTDLGKIPKLERMKDKDLPKLLNQDDSRQLVHLTYGYLLNAKGQDGKYLFRDRFFQTLIDYEEEYSVLLEKHIGKHLASLGLKKEKNDGSRKPRKN